MSIAVIVVFQLACLEYDSYSVRYFPIFLPATTMFDSCMHHFLDFVSVFLLATTYIVIPYISFVLRH